MSEIRRVSLIIAGAGVCSEGEPAILLLSQRGRWLLPAAIAGKEAQTARLALTLLQQLLGPCPGQRMWLLGVWGAVAVYLAVVPSPVLIQGGRWWVAREAVALLSEPEARLVQRARQWLADGGQHRRGIA